MKLLEVVSVENMRKSDAKTIADGTSSAELMLRAARGIYESVKFTGRVAIVCGKGNNGGDGYALACILCQNGIIPTIVRATDGFSQDGLFYYQKAKALGVNEESLLSVGNFVGYDIVVDCLLGTGFSGEVSGVIETAINQINMSNAYIISADINSGINGNTGVGGIAVNSDLTVSIGAYKTGLFLNDAPYYIDKMTNAEIGINLINEEYKLIDYSMLHMFEGYGADVMTTEQFFERTGLAPENCSIADCIAELSRDEHKTIVVKTEHSAVIADLKYVYFCADYVK